MSRVVLISGASRGIGAAVAQRLAADGWRLSLGMRTPRMPNWASRESVHLSAYDAGEAGSEAAWVQAAINRFGRIDAVVANAGIMIPKSVIEATDDDIRAMMDINVLAPRRLAQAAWEALGASGRGRIAIIASLSGKRVKSASSGSYALSKFAAVALSHALRQAGHAKGIRATAICPGFVATDMAMSLSDQPPETMTQPEDLARLVALILDLPNEASVAELAVNWQLEEMF